MGAPFVRATGDKGFKRQSPNLCWDLKISCTSNEPMYYGIAELVDHYHCSEAGIKGLLFMTYQINWSLTANHTFPGQTL